MSALLLEFLLQGQVLVMYLLDLSLKALLPVVRLPLLLGQLIGELLVGGQHGLHLVDHLLGPSDRLSLHLLVLTLERGELVV